MNWFGMSPRRRPNAGTPRARKNRPHGFRPGLEPLEERALMSLTGMNFLVNQQTPGTQSGAVVATSNQESNILIGSPLLPSQSVFVGTTFVAWNHQVSETNFDLRGRFFNANGAPITSELRLASTANNEVAAGVAANAAGNFVVVWTEESGPALVNKTVRAQRFDNTGTAVGNPITVTTVNGVDAFSWQNPQVAMAANGSFVVTHVVRTKTSDTNLLARMFSADGTLLRTISVSGQTAFRETHPSIAMAADGRFAVAYRVGQLFEGRIELRQFSPEGVLQRTVRVSDGPEDSAPSVSMNSAGNMVVAWHNINGFGIHARRVSANGTTGAVFQVSSGNSVAFPRVALNPNGEGFIVGFTNLRVLNGEAAHIANVAEVNANNQSVILTVAKPAQAPAIMGGVTYRSDGRYLLTFSASNSSDSDGGIYARFGSTVPAFVIDPTLRLPLRPLF